MAVVILFASVVRFSVSRMRAFFYTLLETKPPCPYSLLLNKLYFMFYFFGIFFKINFCQPPTPGGGYFHFLYSLCSYVIVYKKMLFQYYLQGFLSSSSSSVLHRAHAPHPPHGVSFFSWSFRFFGVFTFVKKFKCLDSFAYFWIYTLFVDFDIFLNITHIKFLYFIFLYCFGLVWICSKVTSERYFGYYWTPKMA